MKTVDRWYSDRLEQEITVARWGHFGTPVLVFPTAGGDAEEIERHKLVDACAGLLEAGRVKIYSCDSVAGRAMATSTGSPEYRMWLLNQFHHAVRQEVVPAIHADLGGAPQRVVTAGASIGAFNAVALLCRFPDAFEAAIGMSGTFRLQRFLEGAWSDDLFYSSPVDFVPGLDGDHLEVLRQRRVILASGEGEHEDIGESWALAEVLGSKGVPNRVDSWGPETIHDWPTWWRMLPQYLDELC
ncbi:MAG: alpha/beta hydrolase-fold protein [Marmoricola sp.]